MLVRSFIVSVGASTLLLVHFCNQPVKKLIAPPTIDAPAILNADTDPDLKETESSILLAPAIIEYQPDMTHLPISVLDRSLASPPVSADELPESKNAATPPPINTSFEPSIHPTIQRATGQPVTQAGCNGLVNHPDFQPSTAAVQVRSMSGHPAMQVDNYGLLHYRRMMVNGTAPQPHELQGAWRGINKGLATVAIDEQFIKHFRYVNGQLYGDNISVHQVRSEQLDKNGWRPLRNQRTGGLKRGANFLFQPPRGIGPFRHAAVLNYDQGGNSRRDPANLVIDRIVKLDDNHMLGRATVKLGLIRIPLAFFVLERIPDQ